MIFFKLFYTFFKIGLFTIGGGYAMLPMIQAEVTANGWISSAELIDFIAVSESTPGPFAVNISTYIGFETGGFLGALCATFGVVLPSFIIICIVAKCFERFKESFFVNGCMLGLRPAVTGLVAAAAVSMSFTVFFSGRISLAVFKTASFYALLCIFILSLFLTFKKIHPIAVICLSALGGIIYGLAAGEI